MSEQPSTEGTGCLIADSVNLANAKRRAHEWKLHIAERKGHMPFEEVGAYLLDEIIRLEDQVGAAIKSRDEALRQLQAIRAGQTVSFPRVEFDLSPAMVEGTLRDKLIELGWASPGSSPEPSAEERAFAWGWRIAANWAKRDDLAADIGSPAYLAEMRAALTKAGDQA
jgi:hypothetical protein